MDLRTPIPAGRSSMTVIGDVRRTVRNLYSQFAVLRAELPKNDLLIWTAGEISVRVPGRRLLLIKPSGVTQGEVASAAMLTVDLDGRDVGNGEVSTLDLDAHASLHRRMEHVRAVVHTHSTVVCGSSMTGPGAACVLTMMTAGSRGGTVPRPATNTAEQQSRQRATTDLRHTRSSAIFVSDHGPFAVGADVKAAVKAAVMCEDVCRSVHLAATSDRPSEAGDLDIDCLYTRYRNVYAGPTRDVGTRPNDDGRSHR